MLTIHFIFFTITISKRVKNHAQMAHDAYVAEKMRQVQERRNEYTRFLP
ncbi:YrzI family small protein [Aneurinibacillus migulanus]|nr:YrzI family small protein [Aneurinibacillus migulanus]MED4730625.1 YrzI family small protein [Aneurinibacillus migulanus]